ncbi:hypothetical protein [Ancylobacter lacus]|uniref:hypothetical protein n=1 Tax=Ancylobacter lacus TaxID=2579970 RepID=UPI001BCE3630|nr:hypothetical protein [Ancylobacter lacus]MBS7539832.1 hypothetical protein [Ancylobacter lacus]
MKDVTRELSRWLHLHGLNPADYSLKLEAKTITAQRDLVRAFAAEIDPSLSPAAAMRLRPVLDGIETRVTGPLPHI